WLVGRRGLAFPWDRHRWHGKARRRDRTSRGRRSLLGRHHLGRYAGLGHGRLRVIRIRRLRRASGRPHGPGRLWVGLRRVGLALGRRTLVWRPGVGGGRVAGLLRVATRAPCWGWRPDRLTGGRPLRSAGGRLGRELTGGRSGLPGWCVRPVRGRDRPLLIRRDVR